MKTIAIRSALCALLLGLAAFGRPMANAQPRNLSLSEEDRREIVKQMLTTGLDEFRSKTKEKYRSCLIPIFKNKQVVYLSKENILTKFVPKRQDIYFYLMTPDEIAAELIDHQQICYLQITMLRITGDSVNVGMKFQYNQRLCAKCIVYAFGDGISGEFRKKGSRWIAKFTDQFSFVT